MAFVRGANVVIDSSLVLYLDAANPKSCVSGSLTWGDLSGNANNGILSGSTLPIFVSSSYFQFTRSAITSTNSDAFNEVVVNNTIGDDFTISTWINTTQVGNGSAHYQLMYIVSAEKAFAASDFGFGINSGGSIAFGAGTNDVTIAGSLVNTGNWCNVVATRVKSSGLISLYVNGNLSNSGTGNAGNTLNANSKIKIGSGDDSPAFSFGGGIANVQIYNRTLSAYEIQQNYNALKSRFNL